MLTFNGNTVIVKVVLNSKDAIMSVYWPFKKEYKFSDVTYIDIKSSKPNEGFITHNVLIYVGEGKNRVKLETFSSTQANELVSLLRGMLDCSAIEFPEGNEEPFNLPEEKENDGFFAKLFRKKPGKTEDEPEEFISKNKSANAKKKSAKSGKVEEADFEPVFEPLKEKVDVKKNDKDEK